MIEPFIQTYSGKKFFPHDPDPASICIDDIAHALSNVCRFTGHTQRFYSVAEHCVHVSYNVGDDPRVQLWGLLHDASEAYICDLSSPLKLRGTALGEAYRDVEAKIMRAICLRFGLPEREPPEVKLADLRMLSTEARDLFPALLPGWDLLTPYPWNVFGFWPEQAEIRFRDRFHELTEGAFLPSEKQLSC